MAQIIKSNWWGWGGGWASYTAWCWIDITSNVISIDEWVVQTTGNMVCDLTSADDCHYPTALAVANAISGWGGWDMMKSVYDPNNHNADAFDYCNFTNTPIIPTDNCQLSNSCGYITSAALSGYAQTCDIPTDNCQLGNGCWYTTCTWTLTASNISDTAYGSSWDGVTTIAPSKNAVYDKICTIDSLISTNATSSNKLMDKNYIDDSINSVTAYYITKNAQGDQWATYAELAAASTFYSGWVQRTPTKNDYTIVLADENHDNATTRYIYNSGWEYQYTVNETALTQSQLDALNSGITAAKVCCYDAIPVITDNCQIANWCWYTTCTWTVSSCSDVISALWYTPYNSANPSWYTTCTGTLSTCSDVISALWFTPYNCTNPAWYTTCTGTLSATNTWCNWQVLTKTSSWATWCDTSWGDVLVSTQCCNILTSWMSIWAWCQCDYDNLGTYDNNTVYLTIE